MPLAFVDVLLKTSEVVTGPASQGCRETVLVREIFSENDV